MPNNRPRPLRFLWLVVCLLVSFFGLAYPLYVIRPFRYQGARELAVALEVMQIRPYVEIAAVAFAIWLVIAIWRNSTRILPRIGALLLALLTAGFAVLSRVNVYELMFHPLGPPSFTSVAKSKLDGKEQVIAIKVRRVARAYPIRNISYHHIVNDVLAGLPVVATY